MGTACTLCLGGGIPYTHDTLPPIVEDTFGKRYVVIRDMEWIRDIMEQRPHEFTRGISPTLKGYVGLVL